MINFVFEDLENRRNLISYQEDFGPKRFGPSAIMGSLKNYRVYSSLENYFDINEKLEHCIIASGLGESPDHWAGADYYKDNIRSSLFDYLSDVQLDKLRNKKAILLLDQCLEGYQTPWLWQFFHEECKRYNLDPACLVYVTGNMLAAEQYAMWSKNKSIDRQLKVLSYPHFERDIQLIAKNNNILPSITINLEYKKYNITRVKTFNCLNKRTRAHRSWFYLMLYKEGLINKGLVSANDYGGHIPRIENKWPDQRLMEEARRLLPLLVYETPNNEKDDLYYINRIMDQIYLDTWVTVVSEASFSDQDETVFISEKTFKPIACMHPFIILGNRGSLKKLKEMGYKTFHPYINEEYDELSTFDRFDAIIKEIKRIDAIPDKAKWYESMKEILEHNYQVLNKRDTEVPIAHTELFEYYNKYFNLCTTE